MTQKELIIAWLENTLQSGGEITPAKMGGSVWNGHMFGSETSKRCREMRKLGLLTSQKRGKFEVYKLAPRRVQENFPSVPAPRKEVSQFRLFAKQHSS